MAGSSPGLRSPEALPPIMSVILMSPKPGSCVRNPRSHVSQGPRYESEELRACGAERILQGLARIRADAGGVGRHVAHDVVPDKVAVHAVEEHPVARADNQLVHHLPRQTDAWRKVVERRAVQQGLVAVDDDAGRAELAGEVSVERLVVILLNDVARQSADRVVQEHSARIRRRPALLSGEVRKDALVVGGPSVVFPAKAQVQGQFPGQLDVVLSEGREFVDAPVVRIWRASRQKAI